MSDALADLKAGWSLPGDCAAIMFSDHCVQRYGERVRPTLDDDRIRAELSRLLSTARITRHKPDWLITDSASYYLLLTDDIAAPLYLHSDGALHVASFFYREMTEGVRRSNRNRAKATKRSGKQGARRANRMQRGKQISDADASEWER